MTFNAQTQAILASDGDTLHNWGVFINARDKTKGAATPVGIWDSATDLQYTVEGQLRSYIGAQGAFSVDTIRFAKGLLIQSQRVSVNAVAEDMRNILRGYEVERRPADLILIIRDPLSGNILGHDIFFRGVVNELVENEGPIGGTSEFTMDIESSMRQLDILPSLHQSRSGHRALFPADAFFDDATVTASDDQWAQDS